MVEDNPITEEAAQDQPPPEVPLVKAPPIFSRFLFVDVAALRAKQLRRGARVRLAVVAVAADAAPEAPRKAERVAMEEVRQGLVSWALHEPPPEGEKK